MKRSLPGLLGLALCAVAWGAAPVTPPPGVILLDPPRPAPVLRLSDMDGSQRDLARLRGRWVFVHFWASWCGPCREEMPAIQRMTERLADTPLEVVLVNTAESEDDVFSFLGLVAPDLSTLMDSDGAITEQWGPHGLPATFLVDPKGVVRYRALGGRPWDQTPYMDFLRTLAGS